MMKPSSLHLNKFVVASPFRSSSSTSALARNFGRLSRPTAVSHSRTRHFSTNRPSQFSSTTANMVVHNIGDKKSFQTSVEDSAGSLVVVDCFATWCGPCKTIAPVIAQWSEMAEYSDVKFLKIDVDAVPDVAQELGVRAMPTFAFFKDGQKVGEVVGANPKAIKDTIEKYK